MTTKKETVEKKVVTAETATEVIEKVDITKLTPEELQKKINELTLTTETLQKELPNKEYPVKIENLANLNLLIKLLEKNAKWTHQDSYVLVALYNDLKTNKSVGISEDGEIHLKHVSVMGIYNLLSKMEGVGVFEAKAHMKLITSIGQSITDATKLVTDDNTKVRDIHTELAELDKELAAKLAGIKIDSGEKTTKKTKKTKKAKPLATETK